jgi:cyclophilin family peptidyl-prolyl cis-trans isomerase
MLLRSILRTAPLLVSCLVALGAITACDERTAPPASPASPEQRAPSQEGTAAPHSDTAAPHSDTAAPSTNTTTQPSEATAPRVTPPPAAKPDRTKFGPLVAVFEQPSGEFRVDLATRETPRLCANFVNLCERGYYDGRAWGDFSTVVRQTGAGSIDAEPAYTLPREFAPKLLFDVGGNLCMSNTSEDASARARSTRIFVTVKPQDRWNLVYPVFGRISKGLDVAQKLSPGETITRVRIEGDTAPIKAAYAAEIAQWNKAIDAAEPGRAKR